jgi:hypothetical protein
MFARPALCSAILLAAMHLAMSPAQAQPGRRTPSLQVGQLGKPAILSEPSPASRKLRRADLLLQLGIPTLVIGSTTLAVWTALGRPNEDHNADYGCGGWYTPAIVGPITALALAATIYGAVTRRRLKRAGVESAPFNMPLRVFGVLTWSAGFAVGASFVAAQESICST